MKPFLLVASLIMAGALFAPASVQAQDEEDDPINNLPWEMGPTTSRLGDRASIDVPEGYAFLGAEGARQFNDLMENPPPGKDEFVLAPLDLSWSAYFSFDDIGYVNDDEELDADAVLESFREGTEYSNRERRNRGWDELHLVGWTAKPQYDTQLNALAWSMLLESGAEKHQVVNYNTRLLGRRGVMEVTVVMDPEDLQTAIADFKSIVKGYQFDAGEKYSEFKPGDHVAEIGLAALITGGAAVMASKKGWFAALGALLIKFWKLLLIGVVGIGVAAKKLFGGKDKS